MRLALLNNENNTLSIYEGNTLVAMFEAPNDYKYTPEEIEQARLEEYKELA
jgi:hypothetical protein